MCNFISAEILAANALIDIMESGTGNSVTFSKLEDYGVQIVRFLEVNYNESAVVLHGGSQMGDYILNYTKYFNICKNFIAIKDGVTVSDLRKKFRAPLSYELLKAVLSEDARNIIMSV